MRDRLSDLLVEQAKNDPKFFVLSGDHGYALFDQLRKNYSKQFLNVGISEQGMIGYASGMAKMGLRPIVYGLASFVPIRVVEFIKMDICYNKYPVIILGDGAGLVYSTLGSSHQSGEDMAVLRSLPNLKIYSPADAEELEYCFRKAVEDTLNASYIRIGKSDRTKIHNVKIDLKENNGFSITHQGNSDVAIITTGSMSSVGLKISQEFDFLAISVYFINNINIKKIVDTLKNIKNIIIIEEHNRFGGLSTTFDEMRKELGTDLNIFNLTLKNKFTEIASSYDIALKEHGLDELTLKINILNYLKIGDQN